LKMYGEIKYKLFCLQEQYKFLYEMAVEYMDCFETYSNFK